ncbi:hypothetical protein F0562_031550 [Nyssa sinensis]|uniref:Peptide N-acetyl-beta-D-glucosaminyl asparaginase amidase A N-terminal domain-containing protein n=1 Tax=Nyssa sinensis TaxID=561372 RepID=A0A5J5ASU4_9ASTE|nr:hypothetical protein F0562_031550 [Nyssa sinensis]
MGLPPVSVSYSPPSGCPAPWSHVVLELRVSCKGDQYDRIVGVWLDGAEILRTSTAEPTEDGIFWKVRKDVTRYTSLLAQSNLTLTVMLENVVNDVYTGVYHVNVSLLYYNNTGVRVPSSGVADPQNLNRNLGFVKNHETANSITEESKLGSANVELRSEPEEFEKRPVTMYRKAIDIVHRQISSLNFYETPADLIIPISGIRDEGFWFRIQSESDVHSKELRIPPSTWKAVLEVYVSFHGNDEFWYSNPPDSYIRMNNLTTGRGHGAYREVFATIDGSSAGSVIPFPVIFTGGINPLFWEPIVAIGAFSLPSYDFDLTPFLGLLLDGKTHTVGLGVADSISFWLVDANLHLWLDHGSSAVLAETIEAKRKIQFVGWVNSTTGNLTTHFSQQFKLKNSIRFQKNGTYKSVKQKVKTTTEVMIVSHTGSLITRAIFKRKYPLTVITSTLPGSEKDTYSMITSVSHALQEKSSNGGFSGSVYNIQDSTGSMVVRDHSVLSGGANTTQSFSYNDEFGCYSRTVVAANGKLIKDNSGLVCASSF